MAYAILALAIAYALYVWLSVWHSSRQYERQLKFSQSMLVAKFRQDVNAFRTAGDDFERRLAEYETEAGLRDWSKVKIETGRIAAGSIKADRIDPEKLKGFFDKDDDNG